MERRMVRKGKRWDTMMGRGKKKGGKKDNGKKDEHIRW